MGRLYVVPTPIGNLDDMTFRAVSVLKSVGLIAAEDTRVSKKLLDHFEIDTPMTAFHEHNEEEKIPELVRQLEKGDLALVSDAGTPGIADPGFRLVRSAIEEGYEVTPLPGATAFVPALVASGLASDSFVFLGFLPKKNSGRKKVLESIKNLKKTMIIYESPRRLVKTLEELLGLLGDRKISVAREISKKFEEFNRGRISEILENISEKKLVGEITLVVDGGKEKKIWSEEKLVDELKVRLKKGESLKEASRDLTKLTGWSKKRIYNLGVSFIKK